MNTAVFFLAFSLVFAMICGMPSPREDKTIDSFDVSDECSEGGDEKTKEACEGKLVSKDELSSSISSNLNKIGVTSTKVGKTNLQRRNHEKNHMSKKTDIDETIKVLKEIKHEVKAAYIGAVKTAQKLKDRLTPEQSEMMGVYLQQLKIATDYSVEKIDECIKKLKDEKRGEGSMGYSSGGGVDETVEPALVNVFRQYDNLYDYMSDLQ